MHTWPYVRTVPLIDFMASEKSPELAIRRKFPGFSVHIPIRRVPRVDQFGVRPSQYKQTSIVQCLLRAFDERTDLLRCELYRAPNIH